MSNPTSSLEKRVVILRSETGGGWIVRVDNFPVKWCFTRWGAKRVKARIEAALLYNAAVSRKNKVEGGFHD